MASERLFRHDQDRDAHEQASPAEDPARVLRSLDRAGRLESEAQLADIRRVGDGVLQSGAASQAGGEIEDVLADRIQAERSNGQPLPEELRHKAEQKLGADLSAVRVHADANAHGIAAAVGAKAFASGRDIFLGAEASVSDEALLLHEAAHTVQQGMSEERPKTVGGAHTAAEHQAEATAHATAGTPGEIVATSGAVVQRYTDDKKIKGQYARVSDGGNAAVLGPDNYSQALYATQPLIDQANTALKSSGAKGSAISLVKTGESLTWGGKSLARVAPVFKAKPGDTRNDELTNQNRGKDENDTMSLWADCGRSSRVVMGSFNDAAPHATYRKNGKETDTAPGYQPAKYSDEIYMATIPSFLRDPANAVFLKSGIHHKAGDKTQIIEPTTAKQAREQYWELGEEGRRAFDRTVGINTGANPNVGGGYTLNTEYDMPGFKSAGQMTWNFHWAGVVMKDGTDNITLENYADGNGYDSINTDWNFQMYGTVKKGQTFLEQHMASNTHGTRGSAFAVEPDGS